jgi:hypothetical protein
MPLDPQQTLDLTDHQGRCLGRVSIDRIEGNRLFGRFTAEQEFVEVQRLFRDLEEAVNDQIFSLVDKLSGDIDRLELKLASPDRAEQLQVCDTQIMNGTDFCCRVPNLGLTQARSATAEVG